MTEQFKPAFNLDDFTRAYIGAALWSSTDDDGNPLEHEYGADDIAPETLEEMRSDCAYFVQGMAKDLDEYRDIMAGEWTGEARAGHDFWLTRNGHGAGFWDRGLGALGRRLSDAAKVYGSVYLYVGDDGKIHGE